MAFGKRRTIVLNPTAPQTQAPQANQSTQAPVTTPGVKGKGGKKGGAIEKLDNIQVSQPVNKRTMDSKRKLKFIEINL
jgi:hypothetical protein